MTDQEPPVDDVQKALLGTGNAGPYTGTTASGDNPKYQEFKHRRDKERDAEAEKKVDTQTTEATQRYNEDPVVKESKKRIGEAQATKTPEEAAEVEDAENEHVDNVFQERAQAAEAARIQGVKDRADAEAEARANEEHVDPFQNSDYVAPTEEEVAERKEEQLRQRDEYNDQVFQDEQARKEEEFYNENDPNKEGVLDPKGQSARDWEERQRAKIEEGREGMGPGENLEEAEARRKKEADEAERRRKQEEYNAMVNSDDPNVRLKTVEGLANERNEIAMQHMKKMVNAFAQTAAEMGGQMASKGWDLAGNIVKMTFTQPHAMSSTSRMIGTAMSALQTAGDFADRSVQKYGIDVNADPNLMKNTIRYKLYKREAEMGKNTVGNTFRTISESLGNMGLQDASQMTPDQLDQHVQDMRAEADRLTQALKDPKLSNSERSLIKAQAQHLQGYMDGLAKQGAGMAQDQRIAARRQKRQDLATRKQNYQVLADGSPNPYREALEWADPRFGIEVDPQTGRPTNPSAYNRMLNAVITQRQNEAAAAERAGKKLDPAREKWFNDLQNKIYNDIQAMKQDKAENPLRGRAEIYVRIGRVAPGFEKYIDNIEQTGTFPSNSTQSTRAIRKVLSDYLFELKDAGKEGSPEYNHAKALLTSMDKYNNMKKLMSRIAGVMPHDAERARRIHEATENDPYVNEDFSDNGKIDDYTKLVEAYAHLMEHLHRDPVKGGNFNPEDKEYQHYEGIFNDNLTYFVNKWFPGAGWGKGGEEEEEGGDAGGTPGGGAPGGAPSLDDFFNNDEEEDDGGAPGGASPEEQIDPESGDDIDQFIAEVLQRIGMGEPFEEETPQPENPNPAPQPPPEGPSPQPPVDPKKGDRKANARFKATFPETTQPQLRERLHYLGFEFDGYGMVTDPQKYQDFKDQFLKLGVGETEFNKKFGRMKPLRMRSFAEQVYIARKQLAFGPKGAQNSLGAKSVSGARLNSFLVNNPDMAELMSKKLWGEPLTEEEELSVQKALFDAGLIKRIKTPKGDVPPEQEQSETPIEGEAEQPQLPAVTENDFIKPEIASQFKNAGNIENINNGIAAIQSMDRNKRAAGYNDLLYGLGNEIGNDALFSEEYQNLMQTAFMDGSSRAIQLRANQAQDPADKLKTLMAGRLVAPESNDSKRMLKEFLDRNVKDYDSGEVDKVVDGVLKQVQQAQSDKDREKIINNFLESDLSPDLFNHKEGEKSGDETPSEEEAVDPAKFAEEVVGSLDPGLFPSGETDETPVGPDSTDQFETPSDEKLPETTESFEQDEGLGKGIKFPKDGPYKDFKSMAKAMGDEFKATDAMIARSTRSKTRIYQLIGDWLRKNGLFPQTGNDEANGATIEGIFKYLSDNRLINDVQPKVSKKKDKSDPALEGAKSALAAGPAADGNSLKKDNRAVTSFNKLLKDALKNGNLSEEEKAGIEQRFSEFMSTRESDLKKQYSNLKDMTWKAQAVEDFKKTMSEIELAKITPGKAGKIDLGEGEKPDVPKFEEINDPEAFMRSMMDFSKKYWNDRTGYVGPEEDHDVALNELDSSIKDISARIEDLFNKDPFTEEDNNLLNRYYMIRNELENERNRWAKSKDLNEQVKLIGEFGNVFARAWNAAKNYEEENVEDLDYINTNLGKLPFDLRKDYEQLYDALNQKVYAVRNARRAANATGNLEELEKLKNEAQNEGDFDFDSQITTANKNKIDKVFEDIDAGVVRREDLDQMMADIQERIDRMPKEDRKEYQDKWDAAYHKVSTADIGRGVFESAEPMDWPHEIESEKDPEKLEKKREAYENYIGLFNKKDRGPFEKVLKEAYGKAANRPKLSDIAGKMIQSIQTQGARSFNLNDSDKEAWDKALSEASDKEKAQYEKFWDEKIKPAIEMADILEDKFQTTFGEISGGGKDMWKLLSDKVRAAYKQSEDAGNSASAGYEELMRKMRLGGTEKIAAADLLKKAKPKEQTTKSLSVRDLFRARNPDWE